MEEHHVTHPHDLERAVRSLHLPLDPALEVNAAPKAHEILGRQGIPFDEQSDYVLELMANWKNGRSPGKLNYLVKRLLFSCGGADLAGLYNHYFEAHKRLTTVGSLSFEDARLLLNHIRLIKHLILSERMSCSQVARILSTMTRGTQFSWQQIQLLIPYLEISLPGLSKDDTETLYSIDLAEHLAEFVDSAEDEEYEHLVSTAKSLEFPGNSSLLFKRIMNPSFSSSMLVVLHFLLSVCERYDHPLSEPYEFKPRGEAALSLQRTHPGYRGKGSAILNIAKASPVLDSTWAWGRKPGTIDDALVFAEVLNCLESMPYTARRELASWLRQWIVRTNQRNMSRPKLLPGIDSQAKAEKLVELLIADQTHTYGTIEQRVVDALTLVCYPSEEWRSHGRKDSVHASNLSRRKLGDCEYIHRRFPRIHAYEAHAGRLSSRYIRSHFGSLAPVLEQRNDDLEAREAAEDWEIHIIFVAHSIDAGIKAVEIEVEGFTINVETETFAQLYARITDSPHLELKGSVNDNIIGALNESTVPQEFRDRVANLADLPLQS
ncbi:hypothetical protein [Candidatus Poriferisocius sp.]|uniref:hypothetical protein n=1 Tax=Candidatus Poriferisocius sp. TaxID=3101276 RepID=UPI003B025310